MQHSGFVYLWYDRKKKWFCIGSRFGTTDDGYISSTGFLPKAYKKRPEDFKRKILEYYYGFERKELLQLEQKWLDKIQPYEFCLAENKRNGTVRYYNIKPTASGLGGAYASRIRREYWASDKGTEHKKRLSEETTKRNRERKGRGLSAWNSGKKCPTISEARRANPIQYTEEYLEGNRQRAKKLWKDPVYQEKMKNRRKADPAKISQTMKGQKRSEETKRKQSESAKLHTKTKEHKAALSLAAQARAAQILTCPHCSYTGSATAVKRWHFRNCKFTIV